MVLCDGILEIIQQKNVPNQARAILLLHSGSFLPSLGFSGPVIKSSLQNLGTGLADRQYLEFCQQLEGIFVNNLSHFRELVGSL